MWLSTAMRRYAPIALIACIPLLLAPKVRAQTELPAAVTLPPELDRVLRDYETAWRARDPAQLAALFHEDGFVLSNGSPPKRGRDAIALHYANAGGSLHLRGVAFAAQDTVGWIIGLYGPSPERTGGKFVLALRRASRTQPWLIAADIDNTNAR